MKDQTSRKERFRFLSNEEFATLSREEQARYLTRAVDELKRRGRPEEPDVPKEER